MKDDKQAEGIAPGELYYVDWKSFDTPGSLLILRRNTEIGDVNYPRCVFKPDQLAARDRRIAEEAFNAAATDDEYGKITFEEYWKEKSK
jgi:hypothetical protein